MPFVHLQLDDAERGRALAPSLASAIADALDLTPGDVLVSVLGGAAVSDGRGPVADWPSAIIHGSPRPEAASRAALAATRAVLAQGLGVDEERIWAHWSTG